MSDWVIVTGAAGLIGSNLIRGLNELGIDNIIAVDHLARADKFRNLRDCRIADYYDKTEFIEHLKQGNWGGEIDGIFHQGACSDTMATDGRYVMENNYRYSMDLLSFCIEQEVRLIYASSASVYGAGGAGFREHPSCELPLNIYGYSKCLFDQQVRRQLPDIPQQVVGLRYFNVYGIGEAHKGRMASVAWHSYQQWQKQGYINLFTGSGGYADGEQQRDFISVEDIVALNLFFWNYPEVSGIFNAGTGTAQSFNQVVLSVINQSRISLTENATPLSIEECLEQKLLRYIPFPDALENKYQNYTQADMGALRSAGCEHNFLSVKDGVSQYVEQLIRENNFR